MFYSNLGGHRTYTVPTSTHYLPPPVNQPVMLQPNLVGMVPPPVHISQVPIQQPHHPNHLAHVPPQAHQQQAVQPQHQPQPQPQAGQAQPQQAVGGINPVLEYDLNTMSTFLGWCTFGMLKQSRNPTKDFDSLINSVLFATRLPKSTIIIALEYMNQRFSGKSIEPLSELEIFIKLIVALILGNKFNDDNTFTNRSWCGATGLQIDIINLEEKSWLQEVNWQLNVVNFESNIVTLEECWKTWMEKNNYQYSPSYSPTYYSPSYYSSPSYYPSQTYTYQSPYPSPYPSPEYDKYQEPWTYNNIWTYDENPGFVGYTNPYYNTLAI